MNESRRKKFNSLADDYITTKKEEILNEMMDEFHLEYGYRYSSIAKEDLRDNDIHFVQAEYEDTLLRCLERYKAGTNFVHLLMNAIANKRKDLQKAGNKLKKRRYIQKKEDIDTDPLNLVNDGFNLEDDVIRKLTKKTENEQRELIQFFYQQNSDPMTELIMNEIPKHSNLNLVAKSLGIHRETVIRKLNKVKKMYDSSLFGSDVSLYLAN